MAGPIRSCPISEERRRKCATERGAVGTSSTSGGCSARERGRLEPGRRATRATTSARRWGCSASCSSSDSRASCATRKRARSWTRRAPRGGSGCDGHGVPRLPARCSGPARGSPPARPAGRASLSLRAVETLPRGRLPTALRSRRRCPVNGCIMWLPGVSTIPPCRAPSALTAGFRTLPQGRLRKPSVYHPDGMARYALRRTNRRSSGLPAAMILPCACAQGGRTACCGSLPPGDGPLATARSHQGTADCPRYDRPLADSAVAESA